MKKIFLLIIFILSASIPAYGEQEIPIIKDVRGEILDATAQIVIEANCDIDYLDYTLEDPPRLIIDPIGKVYSDLKEVIEFDSGPVRRLTIVKGKPEEGLTGNFYPMDFVSIELSAIPDYKVRKNIREEVIVEITERKRVEPARPEPEIPAEPVKEEEVAPLPEIRIEKTEAAIARGQTPSVSVPSPEEVIPLEIARGQTPSVSVPSPEAPLSPGFIYKIGEGDNLDISVWQHPELDKRVVVRPDGFVSFPLVGDIKASGLAPPQVASNIKENLSKLIKDPQVTVIVSGFGSKNVLVLGEVAKPGAYPYRGGMNILEAISTSGGWKNSAVLNSVMLVRRAFTDQPEAYRLNVYAVIKHGDFTQNLTLEPGDVVYVPKSFVANIGGFIENLRVTVGAYITESTKVFD